MILFSGYKFKIFGFNSVVFVFYINNPEREKEGERERERERGKEGETDGGRERERSRDRARDRDRNRDRDRETERERQERERGRKGREERLLALPRRAPLWAAHAARRRQLMGVMEALRAAHIEMWNRNFGDQLGGYAHKVRDAISALIK